MVCPDCRHGNHPACTEVSRQRRIRSTWTAIVDGALARSLALTTGQVCDCQHAPSNPAQNAKWKRDAQQLAARRVTAVEILPPHPGVISIPG